MFIIIVEWLKAHQIEMGFFRLLEYPIFRLLMALGTSMGFTLIWGFKIIVFLYKKRMKDTSGDFLDIAATGKKGTPTGGGLMILLFTSLSVLLWGDFSSPFLFALLFGMLSMGLTGFIDDYLKVRFKSSLYGMSRKMKTLFQFIFILPFLWFFLSKSSPIPADIQCVVYLPFHKNPVFDLHPWLFSLFFIVAMYAICNSVNITDGKDGLSAGTTSVSLAVFAVFAFVIGRVDTADFLIFPHVEGAIEISVFLAALIGGIAGFLWYNAYPAEVFMGDTGSLAIGMAAGLSVFFIKQEMLFPIVGGVFVVHNFTSLVQDYYLRKKGRRFFHRAPFHHELTHMGMAEPKVAVRLWIVSFVLAVIGLLSLKIR
ncbi:MAG: phospho-N-acetylmuramoyl-pentapeptide-transferase [Acidobacteria bacterium]|nr:MAG: phospho-N-acetylmuramoyl-pentapeptide-transferase [Acidobacteriota bacterium]